MRQATFFTLLVGLSLMCSALYPKKIVKAPHFKQHGSVVRIKSGHSPNAIIEQVKIYANENAQSNKKLERNGVLVRYKNAKATVLICHGFMCDKFDVGFLRDLLPRGEYNFMTFDFRAHGENTKGQCCTLGRDEAYDVIAAGKFLRNHPALKDKPLFVYAFSMGAVASIEAQSKVNTLFDAMVLDCPFDSAENIIHHGLRNLKVSLFGYEFEIPGRTLLEKYAFHPYVQALIKLALKTVDHIDSRYVKAQMYPIRPAESVKSIDVPCFFITCKNDEKIPAAATKKVYEGAAGYKTMWITNGRRHYDSYFYNPEEYSDKVRTFVGNVINGTLDSALDGTVIEDEDDTGLAKLGFNWKVGRE